MSKIKNETLATLGTVYDEPLDELCWLTSKEAARYLRRTVNAIHVMTSRGFVKARKFRGRLYFRRIELDRMIESSLIY